MILTEPTTFETLACFDSTGKQPTYVRDLLRDVTCISLALVFERFQYSDPGPATILEDCARILGPLGASGVAHCLTPGSQTTGFSYVNLRDTYARTIILETDSETFRLGSWCDYFEALEREHEKETGEERCGNCGEYGSNATRSLCCGGVHADGTPSGFHLCEVCGCCSSCGMKPEPVKSCPYCEDADHAEENCPDPPEDEKESNDGN